MTIPKSDLIKRLGAVIIASCLTFACYLFVTSFTVPADQIYSLYFETPIEQIQELEGGGSSFQDHQLAIKFRCRGEVKLRRAWEFGITTLEAGTIGRLKELFPTSKENFADQASVKVYRAERDGTEVLFVHDGKNDLCHLISESGGAKMNLKESLTPRQVARTR